MASNPAAGMTHRRKAVTFFACLGILALIAVSLYVAAPVSTTAHAWKKETFRSDAASAPITESEILELLSQVQDPEIPLSVKELGLVYKTGVTGNKVSLLMTLTSPTCGWAGQLLTEIRDKLFSHPAVAELEITVTYDPPWTLDRIDPVALKRLQERPHTHDAPFAVNEPK